MSRDQRPNARTVLQIQEACLTDIFHFATGLADLRLLEAHACARTPAEYCEGTGTYLKEDIKGVLAFVVPSFKARTIHTTIEGLGRSGVPRMRLSPDPQALMH